MLASVMTILLSPSTSYGQSAENKKATAPLGESACAIHIESDYDIKLRLDEIGCTAGDSLLLYNYSTLSKWEVILPVRVAASLVCDMDKSITDIGAVGAKPYQSVICTYSGKVRRFKSNDENLKGWASPF